MHSEFTIRNLLTQARDHLNHLSSARLDAELLLCNVLQVDRGKLYSSPETIIPSRDVTTYWSLIKERRTGKPLAYLTGSKEFWSMQLAVNQHTLVPRPETECLVEVALSYIPPMSSMSIADLGTGCGAIAIAIAKDRPHCRITATDICNLALETASKNASIHTVTNINFIKSHWFNNLNEKFNLVVSNPPYIKRGDIHLAGDGVAYEPAIALDGGNDGLDAVNAILDGAGDYLQPGGYLIMEHGYDQAIEVRKLYQSHGFTGIQSCLDHTGIARIVVGRYCHG